ncbi:hypothetical protein MRB53_041647 [Persea americana]|nr:hypothetical protein MRB53_041647 [Persea americana]
MRLVLMACHIHNIARGKVGNVRPLPINSKDHILQGLPVLYMSLRLAWQQQQERLGVVPRMIAAPSRSCCSNNIPCALLRAAQNAGNVINDARACMSCLEPSSSVNVMQSDFVAHECPTLGAGNCLQAR